jgi:hypothetical protein
MTLEQFRNEVVSRRGSRKRGAPAYSEELKAFAISHAQGVCATGRSLHAAASELGISQTTLGRFMQSSGDGIGKRVRRVVVSAPVQASASSSSAGHGLTLRTAQGHEVSGLTVEQASALLRALS